MHKKLICLITLAAFICPPELHGASKPNKVRPNIILMMADDMGLGDTSAYQDFTGNSDKVQVHTPQMDRLAHMGVRFTDAHTPSSRCTPTRYALLTGRYPWRNRLKHWVLFGVQGDPMIEPGRPTLATMLRDQGYYTAMVGKWHVGLRYRRADGSPAAGWQDADLTQPMFDTPLDHGFDDCRITSRSHGTSGPQPRTKRNTPKQSVGPGHIHGRMAVGAAGRGKKLVDDGPHAYALTELYDLATDPQEQKNRIGDKALERLVNHLARQAILHRTAGGHRLAKFAPNRRIVFDWRTDADADLGDATYRVGLAGRTLLLDSSRHLGVDEPGSWRLAALTVRVLED